MWRAVIALNLLGFLWGSVVVLGLAVGFGVAGTLLVVAAAVVWIAVELERLRAGAADLATAFDLRAEMLPRIGRSNSSSQIKVRLYRFRDRVGAIVSTWMGDSALLALYTRPWYALIGATGAGKTTALRHSGLDFAARISGAEGSENAGKCTWWLTDQAVILDTAGSLMSDAEDHARWLAFLDGWGKHRKKTPLNGLVVAVAITDLTGVDEREAERLAGDLRRRLDGLTARLETKVPVYLLFTKCDLIPGFVETFGALEAPERGQIWGSTFRLNQSPGEHVELFGRDLEALVAATWRRMVARIEPENRPDRRARIYRFPQQLEALAPTLETFVGALFAPDTGGTPPIMRGIYLTSGIKKEDEPAGSPTATLTDAASHQPALRSDATVEAPSYFLRDLFTEVIFPDREIAPRAVRYGPFNGRRRIAIGAAVAASAVLIPCLPLQSYLHNVGIVESTAAMIGKVATAAPKKMHAVISPEPLTALRRGFLGLAEWKRSSPPVAVYVGMYQGDRLAPLLQRFYTEVLQTELMAPLWRRDIEAMGASAQAPGADSRPTAREYERSFDRLKLHLLLTSPGAANEPSLGGDEQAWIIDQLASRWSQALGGTRPPEEAEEMRRHIAAYLEIRRADPALAMDRNEPAVRAARDLLNRVAYPEVVSAQIIAAASTACRDLSLGRIMKNAPTPIESDTAAKVRGAFTAKGWNTNVRQRIERVAAHDDQWVLGPGTGQIGAELASELRHLYFEQYIDEWSRFIASLRIEPSTGITGSLATLTELTSGQPPPLKKLMQAIYDNTHLSDGEPALGTGGPHSRGPRDVELAFEGFTSFGYVPPPPGPPGEPAPTPVKVPADLLLEEMSSLREALLAYRDDPRTGGDMMARLRTARTATRGLVRTVAPDSWRSALEALVLPPFDLVKDSLSDMKAVVSGAWCSDVVSAYEATLRGRYPFGNAGEASISEVAAFFAPATGILWGFYRQELAGDILQVGDRFKFDNRLGGIVKKSYQGNIVTYLKKAHKVTTQLFPIGGERLSVALEVRLRGSAAFALVALDIGGEVIEHRGGPERWKRVDWPKGDPIAGAALRVESRSGVEDAIKVPGEWGFWRLVEGGQVVKSKEGSFTLKWKFPRLRADVALDIREAGSHPGVLRLSAKGMKKTLRLGLGEPTPPFNIARAGVPCRP